MTAEAATEPVSTSKVTLHIAHPEPLVAILAGVLILAAPRILNYVVAAQLIQVRILGLGLIR